ncbi:MAG TPA: S53 family peptidase, partial [Thermoanaerobaculia bacterium]|nr:S53 family peptidase [Thermoanaerobaculia bacterium]
AFAVPAGAVMSIDEADRVRAGVVPGAARAARDLGPAAAELPVERITLALRPRPGTESELGRLIAAQQDPASPAYHRWLTPAEYGDRFGADDASVRLVLDWLQGHGLAIDDVASGRRWLHCSGTAAQVEETFGASIHEFAEGDRLRHANVSEPTIPRALSAVIGGVLSLDDFPRKHARAEAARRRDVNFQGGDHGMGPADFAVMYDAKPLYDLGIDGSGVTIAVVGRTDIKLTDVQQFRSFFGLPPKDPVFVHNGADPGNLGDGNMDGQLEETEADLDVEWTGAVAPGATIDLVISKSTAATDGADLSAQYAVDRNVAPIISSSFGACERDLDSGNAFYDALWQQAAAEGITVFVPSGDSGPAECDDATAATGTARSVSGLCSTPWDVCVGGTQLDDTADPARWWSPAEDPGTHESLMSYVPEIVWNESGKTPGGSGLLATGGGPSAIYPKPAWQQAAGVPNDGSRDTPDVSLNAAGHDGYVVFQRYDPANGTVYVVNGTSASTAAFAGLMALVVQSQGGVAQGNAGPVFYAIGARQFAGEIPSVFHDVVSGNNTVPGVTGFSAEPGYDLATGLGSVDAAALVEAWAAIAHPRPRILAPHPPPARDVRPKSP